MTGFLASATWHTAIDVTILTLLAPNGFDIGAAIERAAVIVALDLPVSDGELHIGLRLLLLRLLLPLLRLLLLLLRLRAGSDGNHHTERDDGAAKQQTGCRGLAYGDDPAAWRARSSSSIRPRLASSRKSLQICAT